MTVYMFCFFAVKPIDISVGITQCIDWIPRATYPPSKFLFRSRKSSSARTQQCLMCEIAKSKKARLSYGNCRL